MKIVSAPLILTPIPSPENPSEEAVSVFIHNSDGKLKLKKSDGSIVDLETGGTGGSGIAAESDQMVLATQIFS